jgi:hypothetical protein
MTTTLSESARQARARGECVKLLVAHLLGEEAGDAHPRRDAKLLSDAGRDAVARRDAAHREANALADEWAASHDYTEAVGWIRDGIFSPSGKDATRHADRPKRKARR